MYGKIWAKSPFKRFSITAFYSEMLLASHFKKKILLSKITSKMITWIYFSIFRVLIVVIYAKWNHMVIPNLPIVYLSKHRKEMHKNCAKYCLWRDEKWPLFSSYVSVTILHFGWLNPFSGNILFRYTMSHCVIFWR